MLRFTYVSKMLHVDSQMFTVTYREIYTRHTPWLCGCGERRRTLFNNHSCSLEMTVKAKREEITEKMLCGRRGAAHGPVVAWECFGLTMLYSRTERYNRRLRPALTDECHYLAASLATVRRWRYCTMRHLDASKLMLWRVLWALAQIS